jgi:hypothetical protein
MNSQEDKGPIRCKDCVYFRETTNAHEFHINGVKFAFPGSRGCLSRGMACVCPETVKQESVWSAYAGHYTIVTYPRILEINKDGFALKSLSAQ